jgi:ketosteroid isomerase-like protein
VRTTLALLAPLAVSGVISTGVAMASVEHSTETPDPAFDDARQRLRAALAEMLAGNPQPGIDLVAEHDDVTLFGAWGPIEKGHESVVDTFRWVSGRFSNGVLTIEDTVVYASGDLAYTVGFERADVSVDGGPMQSMILRVTHIYRRFGEEWKLVHRHADFPPPDQRQQARRS